jgi:hypothetical protein
MPLELPFTAGFMLIWRRPQVPQPRYLFPLPASSMKWLEQLDKSGVPLALRSLGVAGLEKCKPIKEYTVGPLASVCAIVGRLLSSSARTEAPKVKHLWA